MVFALCLHSIFALREAAKKRPKKRHMVKVYVDMKGKNDAVGKDDLYPEPVTMMMVKVCPTIGISRSFDEEDNDEEGANRHGDVEMVSTSMEEV